MAWSCRWSVFSLKQDSSGKVRLGPGDSSEMGIESFQCKGRAVEPKLPMVSGLIVENMLTKVEVDKCCYLGNFPSGRQGYAINYLAITASRPDHVCPRFENRTLIKFLISNMTKMVTQKPLLGPTLQGRLPRSDDSKANSERNSEIAIPRLSSYADVRATNPWSRTLTG